MRSYNQRDKKRTYGSAEIAANLKHRLCEPTALPSGKRCDAGGFGMKRGGSDTDKKDRHQNPGHRIAI